MLEKSGKGKNGKKKHSPKFGFSPVPFNSSKNRLERTLMSRIQVLWLTASAVVKNKWEGWPTASLILQTILLVRLHLRNLVSSLGENQKPESRPPAFWNTNFDADRGI